MNRKAKYALGVVLILSMLGVRNVSANGTPNPDAACKVAGFEKGFYIQSCDENFRMNIGIELQPQYQFLSMEGQDDVSTFQIRRGRIVFSGYAFDPNFTYKFQYEAVGGRDSTTREGELRGNSLRDAFVNYKVNDNFEIMGGQFKVYNTREELTSSSKLQFAGLSIVNEVFTMARDLGVAVHGSFVDGKMEYGVSVTNEGIGHNTTNANAELLFAGRLVWNILGEHGYTMAAVDNPEDHQLAVGVAGTYNSPSAAADDDIISSTVDVAYRYQRFSLLGSGHYARNKTDSTNLLGLLAQAGFFIVPEKFEVAGRFAGVIPTSAGVVNGYEYTGGLNYYFFGHNLKLQADYSYLRNSALVFGGAAAATSINADAFGGAGFNAGQNDHRMRLQAQLAF